MLCRPDVSDGYSRESRHYGRSKVRRLVGNNGSAETRRKIFFWNDRDLDGNSLRLERVDLVFNLDPFAGVSFYYESGVVTRAGLEDGDVSSLTLKAGEQLAVLFSVQK